MLEKKKSLSKKFINFYKRSKGSTQGRSPTRLNLSDDKVFTLENEHGVFLNKEGNGEKESDSGILT